MTGESRRIIIGLGANLGQRRPRFLLVRQILELHLTDLVASSVFRSDPVGFLDQPEFWNACISGRSPESPRTWLARLQDIEGALGRRPRFRNGPREIDLDLLVVEGLIVADPDLDVPHPGLLERPFALIPASEVAPDLVHPVRQRSLKELRKRAGDLERVCASWNDLPREEPLL